MKGRARGTWVCRSEKGRRLLRQMRIVGSGKRSLPLLLGQGFRRTVLPKALKPRGLRRRRESLIPRIPPLDFSNYDARRRGAEVRASEICGIELGRGWNFRDRELVAQDVARKLKFLHSTKLGEWGKMDNGRLSLGLYLNLRGRGRVLMSSETCQGWRWHEDGVGLAWRLQLWSRLRGR